MRPHIWILCCLCLASSQIAYTPGSSIWSSALSLEFTAWAWPPYAPPTPHGMLRMQWRLHSFWPTHLNASHPRSEWVFGFGRHAFKHTSPRLHVPRCCVQRRRVKCTITRNRNGKPVERKGRKRRNGNTPLPLSRIARSDENHCATRRTALSLCVLLYERLQNDGSKKPVRRPGSFQSVVTWLLNIGTAKRY